jgi:hypothetical protein
MVYFIVRKYILAIWYIFGHLVMLWSFGIYPPFWYICITRNLATLISTASQNYDIFQLKVHTYCHYWALHKAKKLTLGELPVWYIFSMLL